MQGAEERVYNYNETNDVKSHDIKLASSRSRRNERNEQREFSSKINEIRRRGKTVSRGATR